MRINEMKTTQHKYCDCNKYGYVCKAIWNWKRQNTSLTCIFIHVDVSAHTCVYWPLLLNMHTNHGFIPTKNAHKYRNQNKLIHEKKNIWAGCFSHSNESTAMLFAERLKRNENNVSRLSLCVCVSSRHCFCVQFSIVRYCVEIRKIDTTAKMSTINILKIIEWKKWMHFIYFRDGKN